MKYQIKILELNNGKLKYIPQYLKNIDHECKWVNIYHIIREKFIFEHTSNQVEYDSEIEAIGIIEKHKKQIEDLHGYKVKKITFKEII